MNKLLGRFLFYFLVLLPSISISQISTLYGTVSDSMNSSLPNANLLFFPQEENENVKFAISKTDGTYELALKQNITYNLEISYIGYQTINDTIRLSRENATRNYTLIPSNESLTEIILQERASIKIREDTITYRPEKFLTGEERKLRDVLKKLPGLEVDRAGNVTVNGKAVTKLLVDGKEFFTGDEKLGVNNIPADVVKEIEALDNYNEVAFLKGLSDSEQLALNIKLKEGKKKFAFGELEAGGGIEDRYILHPTLFYYSPKTSVNVIGDFNNVGKKSFTVQDYVDFEGGFARLGQDPSAYFKLYNDDFAQFLSQRDFTFNRNNFGAGSINQSLSKNLDLSAYSILSSGAIETRQGNNIAYTNTPDLNENRTTTEGNNLFFNLSKLSLRYIGQKRLDINYEAFLKTNRGDSNLNLNSFTSSEETFLDQNNRTSSFDFTQKLSINKQFNRTHTTSVTTSHKYLDSDNNGSWLFNRPIFSGIIPIDDTSENILLDQRRFTRAHDFNLNVIHYWVLHRFHHIYPEAGIRYIQQDYNTLDAQLINGEVNSFQDAGFNNELDYNVSDTYAGLQYKAKAGKFIFKPGIFLHYYDWKINQQDTALRDTGKSVLLPQTSIDWEISSAHKVKLRYNLNSRFAQASQFANRLSLNNFNQVFAGNEDLENELYHSLRLTYSKFSLFKGTFFNAGLNYTNRLQSIRNSTTIEGIDQINTLIYTSLPENTYGANANLTKLLGSVKILTGGTARFSDYSRNINGIFQDFTSQNFSYNIGARSNFKNAPNFDITWNQRFNNFTSATTTNKFTLINPQIDVEWRFLEDFVISGDYNFTYYENRTTNEVNRFSLGNMSLLYAKEDSPWTFTLEVDNIFDTRFRNENSFNQFLVNDTRTFIQERTLLFKVSYGF